MDELWRLSETHPNFHYIPCVDSAGGSGLREERADLAALRDFSDLKGWRVYLCGHPGMVNTMKRKAYLAGAALQDIYADPFVVGQPCV